MFFHGLIGFLWGFQKFTEFYQFVLAFTELNHNDYFMTFIRFFGLYYNDYYLWVTQRKYLLYWVNTNTEPIELV